MNRSRLTLHDCARRDVSGLPIHTPGIGRSRLRRAAVVMAIGVLLTCTLFPGAAPMIPAARAQQPAKLEPLPEVSAPPQIPIDPKLEPEVRIFNRGADKIEEFRVNGKLYMVRVTPPGGAPYVLLDQTGGGQLMPSHGQADPRSISVPMWVIATF